MKVRFPAQAVRDLMKMAKEAGDPGILIVGGEGIYLMGPNLDKVYAKECDPTDPTQEDTWYEKKMDIWGGDRDDLFLPMKAFVDGLKESTEFLEISITQRQVKIFKAV